MAPSSRDWEPAAYQRTVTDPHAGAKYESGPQRQSGRIGGSVRKRTPTRPYDHDVDENTARSMLGLTSQRLLTTGRVEMAYAAARERAREVDSTSLRFP